VDFILYYMQYYDMIQPLPVCIVAADIYVCMHTVTNDKITVWITSVSGS